MHNTPARSMIDRCPLPPSAKNLNQSRRLEHSAVRRRHARRTQPLLEANPPDASPGRPWRCGRRIAAWLGPSRHHQSSPCPYPLPFGLTVNERAQKKCGGAHLLTHDWGGKHHPRIGFLCQSSSVHHCQPARLACRDLRAEKRSSVLSQARGTWQARCWKRCSTRANFRLLLSKHFDCR